MQDGADHVADFAIGDRLVVLDADDLEEGRILVEVQALVSTSTFGNARRMAIGIDQNRLSLLLAVLEKRAGLNLAGDDVYVNIAGGMSVEETAADLSVLASVGVPGGMMSEAFPGKIPVPGLRQAYTPVSME